MSELLALSEIVCDECERTVPKITRTYKEKKYCLNCYLRVFKRRLCPKCGNFARLNKYDEHAICSKCISAKPCARCHKTDYDTGKLTKYGMVCNACAPYFRELKPCELCGTPSNRLTKVSRLNHDLSVCPKCARADHETCPACRRHRLLVTKNGKKLCKKCHEIGEVPCAQCQQPMPAGYGNTCEQCYWKNLLQKRTDISCAGLTNLSKEFGLFSEWLVNEVGAQKAAITINKYFKAFSEIEGMFDSLPDYEALLHSFGAAKLRQFELPMRWMAHTGLIVVDAQKREEDTEKRRITKLLDKVNTIPESFKLLQGYYQQLIADLTHDKTTLRSMRLALSPASSLLLTGAEMGFLKPNQNVLDAYLKKSAGQRAAVSGFVNYLRDVHGVEIGLPKLDVGKAQKNRRKKLEAEMLELMRQGKAAADNREWLSVALAYFHGLPRSAGKTIDFKSVIVKKNGGIMIVWQGMNYWVSVNGY